MNEQKRNWEKFKKTGKIEDYLKYKKTEKTDSRQRDV